MAVCVCVCVAQGFLDSAAAEEEAKRTRDLTQLTRKDLSARLDAKSEELKQISARVTAQKEARALPCVCVCVCACWHSCARG